MNELGSVVDDVISKFPVLLDVLEDPYLPTVLDLLKQVSNLPSAPIQGPGIGLKAAVFPLRSYLYVRRNPWVPWVAGVAVLAIPFVLGMVVGRVTTD